MLLLLIFFLLFLAHMQEYGCAYPSSVPAYELTSAVTYISGEFDICTKLRPDVFTLIYIHSAPSHFKHRAVIRRTFGNINLYSKLRTVTVFFLGQSTDLHINQAVLAESERYHDIIQAQYEDSYKNLSLKAISALNWLNEHCLTSKYVLKVDDDIFVNIFKLVQHLQLLSKYRNKSPALIHCRVWNRVNVIRNSKSKYYVPKQEYPDDKYPAFCSGSSFFMETSLVSKLLRAAFNVSFLRLDDTYVTGLMAKEAGIKHNPINSIVVLYPKDYDCKSIDSEAVFIHLTGEKNVDLRHNCWKKMLLKENYH